MFESITHQIKNYQNLYETLRARRCDTTSGRLIRLKLSGCRISEGTFRPPGTCYCDWFCVIFGTKLGGVLLFRLCLEKGVWLLVSCFRRWAAPATAAVAAAAAAISSHQQQQQQQQWKLDSIGLDFEQEKRGYKRGYERISSRISEETFRPPGTSYCDWFCVIFGTKLGGVLLFRLCLEKDVCLLVSCISSHQQQQQPQQSKLDWTGLDF